MALGHVLPIRPAYRLIGRIGGWGGKTKGKERKEKGREGKGKEGKGKERNGNGKESK